MNARVNEGLWAWRQSENHNDMMQLQERVPDEQSNAAIDLAYFGGSAFRITTPSGLTIMLDPWRNYPVGNRDWFLYEFPRVEVDIGVSTHAHFDHDGLHALSAHVLLDRLIGVYEFADVRITGIADKHVSDSSHCTNDWADLTRRLTKMETQPPNNWRSYDNCLMLIEAAGLRILHWGDNRPTPPDSIWDMIGNVDIALLPIDGSYHVLSPSHIENVIARLSPKLIVPHHYGIWDLTTRGSTLLPPNDWVDSQSDAIWADSGVITLESDFVRKQSNRVLCFGDNVAFEKPDIRTLEGSAA